MEGAVVAERAQIELQRLGLDQPVAGGVVDDQVGEVGLAGEVRAISQAERRISECARLGFTNVVLPKYNLKGIRVPEGVRVIGVETVAQTLGELGLLGKH